MKKRTLFHSCFAVFLAAVMLISVLPGTALAVSSSEIKEELNDLKDKNKEIQAQINGIRRQYNANASEIQELVDNKNAIDQEIALLHTQIININEQISVYSQLIADNQEELEVSQAYLDQLNAQSRERIQAMEEEGELSYWEVIFQSASLTEMRDRLTQLEAASRMIETIQSQMNEEKAGLEESQAELAESEAALDVKRTESDDILRELAKKQDEFQALLDESEALQDDLMQQIAKKEKEYSSAKYKEELAKQALAGQNPKSDATWITPVSGYHISSPFGMRNHPILGYARMHNGVDMACAQGTPIYATRAGTVTAASYQAGGAGNYVSINHGDGFASIYMHMTHYVVSAGQSVSAGQLIGYVGSTGLSTGPHLHFGISYAGTYVNPLAYI